MLNTLDKDLIKFSSMALKYPKDENFINSLNTLIESDALVKDDLITDYKNEVKKLSLIERQEVYTRLFDLNSMTCLDVGYLLFGEDYKRGAFLVEMKRLMNLFAIDCESELFDHLPYMLELISKMDEIDETSEKVELIEKIIMPALQKIEEDFSRNGNINNIYYYPVKILNNYFSQKYKMDEAIFKGCVLC